jgi:hypothetical protein
VNETSVIDSFVDFDRVNVNGRDVRIVDAVLRQRVLEPVVEDFSSERINQGTSCVWVLRSNDGNERSLTVVTIL